MMGSKRVDHWGGALWRACNLTAFIHSSTGPVVHPVASHHEGPRFNPPGVLMWNLDSPISVVSLHWWPWHDRSLWPRLRQASLRTVTRPSYRQYDNPTWSHTSLLPQFHACCRSFFRLHNRHSLLLGGDLWRACNLTAFIHSSTGPVVQPVCFLSWGTQVQSLGGYLSETWILLLALSRYRILFRNKMSREGLSSSTSGSQSFNIKKRKTAPWFQYLYCTYVYVRKLPSTVES
jgi:hypothetical protein